MKKSKSWFVCRQAKVVSVFAFVFAISLVGGADTLAASSEEAAIKLVQRSSYNIVTGNWDVALERTATEIGAEFKEHLPSLAYHLVEEEIAKKNGSDRVVLVFRGEGDHRVVVKLKEEGSETNVRVRVGLTGSEAKSAEIFKYVFMRM